MRWQTQARWGFHKARAAFTTISNLKSYACPKSVFTTISNPNLFYTWFHPRGEWGSLCSGQCGGWGPQLQGGEPLDENIFLWRTELVDGWICGLGTWPADALLVGCMGWIWDGWKYGQLGPAQRKLWRTKHIGALQGKSEDILQVYSIKMKRGSII